MHQRTDITSNSSLIYITRSTIDDSFEPTLHSHPNLEVLLIAGGEGRILTASRSMNVKEGDLVIINPNSRHCEIGSGLHFYAIGLENTEIFLKESFKKKIIVHRLDEHDYMIATALYKTLQKEASEPRPFSEGIIDGAFASTLALLQRSRDIVIAGGEGQSVKESSIVHSIKSLIDNNYVADIRLDDIAYRLSQSKSSICHVFKEETGMTIIAYKIKRQLEEAKNLLETSDMTVAQVGYLVGFHNPSYFIKEFRSRYGDSPSHYRKKQHKK